MPECAVIGGGVVGLSIAYELAQLGANVTLAERGQVGREASCAGAGILPPPTSQRDVPAWKRFQADSYRLHGRWHEQLREETGIDNGYCVCGALHLAHRVGEAAALRAEMAELAGDGVRVRELTREEAVSLEPGLQADSPALPDIHVCFHLPDEAQIRNPHHLQALAQACRQRGVVICENQTAQSLRISDDSVEELVTSAGILRTDSYVFCAGAWSEMLLTELGLNLSVYPVRGQMLLYQCESPPASHIINEGPRYIVPRNDGRVLVGSTEEDVGFDKHTTEEGLAELRQFAETVLPGLAGARIEKTWAGLRPHAVDGFPYIGRVPHLKNAYVAAGHYRAGLSTSTGTATAIAQLITEGITELDIVDFRLDR